MGRVKLVPLIVTVYIYLHCLDFLNYLNSGRAFQRTTSDTVRFTVRL